MWIDNVNDIPKPISSGVSGFITAGPALRFGARQVGLQAGIPAKPVEATKCRNLTKPGRTRSDSLHCDNSQVSLRIFVNGLQSIGHY